MTVSTSYTPLTYSGNDATTAFSVTWPFFTGTLVVTLISSTGVETVKTISTHYTVSGGTASNGLPATGTVTMLTAPATGETLRITRSTTRTQASTWAENDPFPQKTIEAALDKLTMISQESAAGGADDITGDVLQLNSAGATDYWDGEGKPLRLSYLEVTEAAAPDTPDSGYGRLYAKTDGNLYYLNDAGTESSLSEAGAAATEAAASAAAAASSASAAAASAAGLGLTYTYSTTTTMDDPGTGVIRLDNATLASATAAAIDDLSADSGNPDVSARILTWDDSTNTIKGELVLAKRSAPQNYASYHVTGLTDNAGWTELALTYVGTQGTLADGDTLVVTFNRAGDAGADGAGSGDVTAAASFSNDNRIIRSDGTGKGVQASAVVIADTSGTTYPAVSDAGALGTSTFMWSDLFLASGAVINFNNGNVTLTHGAGALTFAGATTVSFGTSAAITLGSIELGAASDTTVARASAGEVNIESNRVWHQGNIGARIDALTADASPDSATDYVVTYDASASAAKKVLLSNLGSSVSAADQADQETATNTTKFVSPGIQHYHPSAAKAWVRFNASGTIAASYNITSITDNGTGNWTVNIATDFSSGNYVGVAMCGQDGTARGGIAMNVIAAAAGTFQICSGFIDSTGVYNPIDPGNPNAIFAVFFGDQ